MDYARRQFNEAQLREYLDKTLAFVEKYYNMMDHEFCQLCDQWADTSNQASPPQEERPSALKIVKNAMLRSMVFTLPIPIILIGVNVVWRICKGTMSLADILAIFLNLSLLHAFIGFSFAIRSSFKFWKIAKKLGWLSAAAHYHSQNPLCCFYCLCNHFAQPFRIYEEAADYLTLSLCSLAEALQFLGQSSAAAALLENYLELGRTAYTDANALAQRLQRLNPNVAAALVATLAMVLPYLGRAADAVALLKNHLGLTRPTDTNANALAKRLKELDSNIASALQIALADALRFLERYTDAAALLENHLGLGQIDYSDANAIAQRMQKLEPNNAANLVQSLANVLLFMGREADAAALLENYLSSTAQRVLIVGATGNF